MVWDAVAQVAGPVLGGAAGGLLSNQEHYGPGDYLPNGWGKNLLRPSGVCRRITGPFKTLAVGKQF